MLGSREEREGLRAMSRCDERRIIIVMIFVSVLLGARAERAQSKAGSAGDAVKLNNQGLEYVTRREKWTRLLTYFAKRWR